MSTPYDRLRVSWGSLRSLNCLRMDQDAIGNRRATARRILGRSLGVVPRSDHTTTTVFPRTGMPTTRATYHHWNCTMTLASRVPTDLDQQPSAAQSLTGRGDSWVDAVRLLYAGRAQTYTRFQREPQPTIYDEGVTPDLSRRLARALNRGFPRWDERAAIRDAVQGPNVREFKDLPAKVRALVLDLETRPRPAYLPTKEARHEGRAS